MRIRYCFIEDQDCTKLTKGKTPDILMSLHESYLTKCYPTLRIHTVLEYKSINKVADCNKYVSSKLARF